jgi:c-di-GMP-binding flagellar brake protein YcgR
MMLCAQTGTDPAMTAAIQNRRSHARADTTLGCKILRPAVARYLSARTADVSAGGALLDIDTTRPLIEGEEIEIGVAWTGTGLLSTRDLVTARVVRTEPAARATASRSPSSSPASRPPRPRSSSRSRPRPPRNPSTASHNDHCRR